MRDSSPAPLRHVKVARLREGHGTNIISILDESGDATFSNCPVERKRRKDIETQPSILNRPPAATSAANQNRATERSTGATEIKSGNSGFKGAHSLYIFGNPYL